MGSAYATGGLRELARLRLPAPPGPGRPAHVTAASGLVSVGGVLYVVSDDDYLVSAFPDPAAPGTTARLCGDELPTDPDARKAAKPDIESLARLCDLLGAGADALVALGSGSTPARDRAWLVPVCDRPLSEPARETSAAPLYEALRRELDDLNIEGLAADGDRLWLAQRGNGAHGHNALVELDARPVCTALRRGDPIAAEAVLSIRRFEVGMAGDVPLTPSDLEPLGDGRLLFCAVAESGQSTYHDGECVGSAMGVLDPSRGRVEALLRLPEPRKIEGAALVGRDGDTAHLLVVEDPDDAGVPAPLLELRAALAGGAGDP